MKKSKAQLIIVLVMLSSLALLAALQISWIIKTARMQEAQFNHTVNTAMNRIIVSLSQKEHLCSEVNRCLKECSPGSCCLAMKNMEEWANIKTVIENDLRLSGINLDFEFDIVDKNTATALKTSRSTYLSETLERILEQSGYRLLIRFPEKKDFLMAQIGYVFVLSIILLLIIALSFIMILRLYKREKQFSSAVVDFINNMAHELKTPLTNISLAVNMISASSKIKSDDKLSSYAGIISSERSKLKEKIDRLLSASFAENGNTENQIVFNALDAIRETAGSFSFPAGEKNGEIKLNSEGSDFRIKGDPARFRIMLGNILDNSLKYSGNAPEVNINLKKSKGNLIIDISDNGPGIPEKYYKKVFEKFFRVPSGNVHKTEGFGLGLYQARQIALQMNGDISISRNTVNGLTVSITIPLAGEDE